MASLNMPKLSMDLEGVLNKMDEFRCTVVLDVTFCDWLIQILRGYYVLGVQFTRSVDEFLNQSTATFTYKVFHFFVPERFAVVSITIKHTMLYLY